MFSAVVSHEGTLVSRLGAPATAAWLRRLRAVLPMALAMTRRRLSPSAHRAFRYVVGARAGWAFLFGAVALASPAAAGPLERGPVAIAKSGKEPDLGHGPLNHLRESDAALAAILRKHVPTWSPEAGPTHDRLRRVLASLLDYRKMAEQVLGSSWASLDEAQRATFVDVFSTLTNQAFVSAASKPSGRVRYLSETVQGDEARVFATSENEEAARALGQIEYKLTRSDDRWLIYDVIVDGVSLTASYQEQLQTVLRRDGFDELVARMRRRIERPRD